MPSLAWIGSAYFVSALCEGEGAETWRVVQADPPAGTILGWDDIVALAGFIPDALVVADKSTPPFVLGMEEFPRLTVLYAVDTHIHSWLPLYA